MNRFSKTIAGGLVGLALASGGCDKKGTYQGEYENKTEQQASQKFDANTPVSQLEAKIIDVQSGSIPFFYGSSNTRVAANYPLTYVFVKESNGSEKVFIYPYSKAFPIGKTARISYRSLNGSITTEEFLRNFASGYYKPGETNPLISADGVMTGNGIEYKNE